MKFTLFAIITFSISVSAFAQTERQSELDFQTKERIAALEEADRVRADAAGEAPSKTIYPDLSNMPPEIFEVPLPEKLPDCLYTVGRNFPSKCFEAGNPDQVIFDSAIDTQDDLNKLRQKYGRSDPRFNVIPPNHREEMEQLRKELGPDIGSQKSIETIYEYTDYRSQEDRDRQAKLGKQK